MAENDQSAPFEILMPKAWSAPVIFNSPHSGRLYDPAFLDQSRLSLFQLRRSEDSYVDELFLGCLDEGAPMLRVHTPRSFVDLNREPFELDPRMFFGPLPGYVNTTSPRVAGGLGTIPRIVAEGSEIYRGRLHFTEVQARVEGVYFPYHRALAALVQQTLKRSDSMLLIDCHSMPSSAISHLAPAEGGALDVVLGDRFGASCSEELTVFVEEILQGHGLRTVRNKPYAGGFITKTHGAPHAGQHALQIELNRALYLDETTLEKSEDFEGLRRTLGQFLRQLVPAIEGLLALPRLAAE